MKYNLEKDPNDLLTFSIDGIEHFIRANAVEKIISYDSINFFKKLPQKCIINKRIYFI